MAQELFSRLLAPRVLAVHLALALLVSACPAAASAGDSIGPGSPVTVSARVHLVAMTGSRVVPLLGLSQNSDGGQGIALLLASEATGWFPAWKLRLSAPRGWVTSYGMRLIVDDPPVYELGTVIPEVGHEYEAALSYTPNGYLFVSLRDLTPGSEAELYTSVVSARMPVQRIYPVISDPAAVAVNSADAIRLLATEVAPKYIGKGLPSSFRQQFAWSVVLDPLDEDQSPLEPLQFFQGDSIGLQLTWPGQPVPGHVRLLAVQGTAQTELLFVPWQPGTHTVPLAGPLPAGEFNLRLEYVDGEYVQTLAEKEAKHVVAWERIPAADLSQLTPDMFSDDELFIPYALAVTEQHMPYYLAHFHRLANAVQEDGFIDISVWRNQRDNARYNARIMENILSLAYFYTTKRAWNPYYASPALRARLEAALRFWVGMQNGDGRFSEYGPGEWNLAATAFATKFMGETILLLHDGPPIDPDLFAAVVKAQRKAIMVTLTDPELYRHGLRFTNQFGNVWPAVLAYLKLFPDPEMERQFLKRLDDAQREFQSPAGFYYEADSVDWGYNMGTHRNSTRMVWHYGQGAKVLDRFVAAERLWYEWLSYNALREPDGSSFLLNRAIETRQRHGSFRRLDTELVEAIPLARAFATTHTEREAGLKRLRAELAARWPAVKPLVVGEFYAFSPYPFLHQANRPWLPSEEEREAAIALLPYMASAYFNHQRVDSRHPLVITYLRRPHYYAIFNAGEARNNRQRFGIGIVWHQGAGGFLQTQSGSNSAAWGTRAADAPSVYEVSIPEAAYEVAGSVWSPHPGAQDAPQGDVGIRYRLGANGRKRVLFGDLGIDVHIEHRGAFVEQIPLLKAPGDELRVEKERVVLKRRDISFVIEVTGGPVAMKTVPSSERIERYEVVVLQLAAESNLSYRMLVSTDGAVHCRAAELPT